MFICIATIIPKVEYSRITQFWSCLLPAADSVTKSPTFIASPAFLYTIVVAVH